MFKLALPIIMMTATASGVAVAQQPLPVQPIETVSYADLNLATSDGQASLDRRIAGAVRRVCPSVSNHNWMESMASRTCRRQAHHDVALQRREAIAAFREGRPSVRVAVAAR
jgi:UrcA family protein